MDASRRCELMTVDELVAAVRARAQDRSLRTDTPNAKPDLAPLASDEQVAKAERLLGWALHPLHRALMQAVANGGFGPGDGFIGLPGGRTDDDGRSVVELRNALFSNDAIVPGAAPLWDFGCGAWACLESQWGSVLIVDEYGVTDTQVSLFDCLVEWVAGNDVSRRLFTFEERAMTNPFTRQNVTVRTRGRALGKPYRPA